MVVEVVLPTVKSEILSGVNVFREIIKVGGFGGDEIVGLYRFLVEVGIRFNSADFLGEVLMVKVLEDFVFFEEVSGMKRVGVGEKNQTMSVGMELIYDVPHRGVGRKNVLPGFSEHIGREVAIQNLE